MQTARDLESAFRRVIQRLAGSPTAKGTLTDAARPMSLIKSDPLPTQQSNQETMTTIPHQSKGPLVRFPGSTVAAAELGVTRGHLHRVLTGKRKSPPLLARWNAWLRRNPQYASLQPRR
jgi:hypothetical protein